ncbi:MAG: hypothetical protein ACOYL1_06615 [Chlamydiia bacterium]
MRYDLPPKLVFFYKDEGFIELENLLSEEELLEISRECDHLLKHKLKAQNGNLATVTLKTTFQEGWNLHQESSILQKFITQKKFLEIVGQLTGLHKLKLGFTQIFRTFDKTQNESDETLPPLFYHHTSLNDVTCLQGLEIGCMIHLVSERAISQDPLVDIEHSKGIIHPLPMHPRSITFFNAKSPFSLDPLPDFSHQLYLLITFGRDNMVYVDQPNDPHTHNLKKQGLVFGDVLPGQIYVI